MIYGTPSDRGSFPSETAGYFGSEPGAQAIDAHDEEAGPHVYATARVDMPIRYSYYTGREPDRMEFEFDPAKSASNLEKHGIDFDGVEAVWQDLMRIEIPARTTDEPRWLVVGQIDGKHWSVVVTYREQRVRIISARRSRKEEVALYEG